MITFWVCGYPAIELVLLPSCSLLCIHSAQLLLCQRRLLNLSICPTTFGLVSRPPGIALPRRPVHRTLHEPKVRRLDLTRSITLPNMSPIAVNFVMESVVYGNLVVAVVVDRVGEQLKPSTMPCPIIAPQMCPRGCDEEVGVDGFVQERVDGVGAWAVLQQ
jgi:hypothetical protein